MHYCYISPKQTLYLLDFYCIAAASIDPSKTLLTLDPLARLIGTIGSSGAIFPPGAEGATIFRPIGTARRFADEALSQPDPQ